MTMPACLSCCCCRCSAAAVVAAAALLPSKEARETRGCERNRLPFYCYDCVCVHQQPSFLAFIAISYARFSLSRVWVQQLKLFAFSLRLPCRCRRLVVVARSLARCLLLLLLPSTDGEEWQVTQATRRLEGRSVAQRLPARR